MDIEGQMRLSQLMEIPGVVAGKVTAKEVEHDNADKDQRRPSHQHQGQFHGILLAGSRTPYTDQQVFGNNSYLQEEEKHKQVCCNEEAIRTEAQQRE